jgi:hypothetical protein
MNYLKPLSRWQTNDLRHPPRSGVSPLAFRFSPLIFRIRRAAVFRLENFILFSKVVFQMKPLDKELSVKLIRGPLERKRKETIWHRFDRLQRSLRPLRKGQHISRGIHYGR